MSSIKMQSLTAESIVKAIKMIHELVREEINLEQQSLMEKKGNYRTVQTTFRIILTKDEAKYLIKNLDLPKLCEKRRLMIEIKEEPENPIIEKGIYIASIRGRNKDIDHAICNFCEIMEEFFQKNNINSKLSILVSKYHTGFIIGPEGSIIKTIAVQSGGAKINIENIKRSQNIDSNNIEERIVNITGRLIAREIAASLIKDKIEQTKLERLNDTNEKSQYKIKSQRENTQEIKNVKDKNYLGKKIKESNRNMSSDRESEDEAKIKDSSHEDSSSESIKNIQKDSKFEEINRSRSREKLSKVNKKQLSKSSSSRSSYSSNEDKTNKNVNMENKNARKSQSKSSSKSASNNEEESQNLNQESIKHKMEEVNVEKIYDESNMKSEEVIRKNYFKKRNDRGDACRNISFEERGQMKIAMNILAPKYITPLLIGKSGVSIREMENKTNATITFWKKNVPKINLENDEEANIVQLMGTTKEVLEAFKTIMKRIMLLESTLNDKKIGRI